MLVSCCLDNLTGELRTPLQPHITTRSSLATVTRMSHGPTVYHLAQPQEIRFEAAPKTLHLVPSTKDSYNIFKTTPDRKCLSHE